MTTPRLLTPVQELLVKKWMPLAYGIVNKQVGGDKAEQLSRALWALTKFARLYDASKGYSEQALATRAIGSAMIDCHRAAARHLGNVELKDHHLSDTEQPLAPPPPKWEPPADEPDRKVRAAGQSARSLHARAKEQGWARRQGRPRALDGQSLLRILDTDPHISTTALALSLGVHRNLFHRCSENRKLLARCRELACVRIFGHGGTRKAGDRATSAGQTARPAAAQVWR